MICIIHGHFQCQGNVFRVIHATNLAVLEQCIFGVSSPYLFLTCFYLSLPLKQIFFRQVDFFINHTKNYLTCL